MRPESCVADAKGNDKVLRHAVFFKFKDGTTKEQLKDIVDAFRPLPARISQNRRRRFADSSWAKVCLDPSGTTGLRIASF